MTSNFRKKIFLNIGAGLTALVLFILAIVLIGIDAEKNSEFIFATNAAISSKSRIAADLARLRDQEKLAEPILAALKAKIPDEDSILTFSVYVKSLAEKHNATSTFRFGEETRGADFNSIRFNASAQGDYASVVRFLNEFENAPYFINITNFSIIKQQEKYSGVIDGNIMFGN